jgi:leucyl-tRNA synthetase
MESFDHSAIEKKWQEKWEDEKLYETQDVVEGKKNRYLLVEYPYPSGDLHVGHWYAFAVPDIYARFRRMKGDNVLFPIGFDSFGLPAENAAIKRKLDPKKWTYDNIDYMVKQLRSMGNSFDWSRQVITSDPEYYKWTQWLFLQLYKNNVAYKKTSSVPWCDKCKTVLANEQIVSGTCERCGTSVIQKDLDQWFFKITDYAERLLNDLNDLDWPNEIKEAQREWIGKSEGALLRFEVPDVAKNKSIEVFTTRPDTLFGATYVVLAPEHENVDAWRDNIENWPEVEAYRTKVASMKELERREQKEKTGVELKGISAINPATKERIPVWIADYVLAGYGTSSIMAVPAHDERDFAFAKKFDLPITYVIAPHIIDKKNAPQKDAPTRERVMVHALIHDTKTNTYLFLKWKKNPWTTFVLGGVEEGESLLDAAVREVEEETGYTNLTYKGQLGGTVCTEYYAAHKNENRFAYAHALLFEIGPDTKHTTPSSEELEKHEPVWMTVEEFEADPNMTCSEFGIWKKILENEQDSVYTGDGILVNSGVCDGLTTETAKEKIVELVDGKKTVQYRLRDWLLSRQRYWGCPIPVVYDPEGKPHPIPEEHLPWILPEDVNFIPTGDAPLAESEILKKRTEDLFGKGWTPEVDTMDTFVDSSWYFLRYLDPHNDTSFSPLEKQKLWMPVARYSGGAEHTTMHVLYSRFFQKALFDMGLVLDEEPYKNRMNRSLILGPDGAKMSKSKGNVINPDEHVARVGADIVKTYLAFIGPYNEVGQYPWDLGGVAGVRRFYERVWGLRKKVAQDVTDSDEVLLRLHQTIKKVGEDTEVYKFNTAISQIMILLNVVEKEPAVSLKTYETLVTTLAPFAPHLMEEIWESLGHTASIHKENWPQYDQAILDKAVLTIVVQVNGKTRASFTVPPETDGSEITKQAKELPQIISHLEGKKLVREIVVPNRLINLVVDEKV